MACGPGGANRRPGTFGRGRPKASRNALSPRTWHRPLRRPLESAASARCSRAVGGCRGIYLAITVADRRSLRDYANSSHLGSQSSIDTRWRRGMIAPWRAGLRQRGAIERGGTRMERIYPDPIRANPLNPPRSAFYSPSLTQLRSPRNSFNPRSGCRHTPRDKAYRNRGWHARGSD